jgi:hypothetical protein
MGSWFDKEMIRRFKLSLPGEAGAQETAAYTMVATSVGLSTLFMV